MLVFLVALVIAIPIVSVSASKTASEEGPTASELPPVIEVDTSDTQTTTKPYKFKNAYEAYNHVLNSTLSKSFQMKSVQSIVASADVGVGKLNFDQSVSVDTYFTSDGRILEETISTGTKQFFNSTYFDGTDVYTKTVNGNFSNGQKPSITPEKYSKQDYLAANGVMPGYLFTLNKKNSTASSFSKSGSTYTFKLTITDKSIFGNYLKKVNIMSESQKFPEMNGLSIDFEVSAKTGNLLKMTITEEYKIKHTGLDVTCYSTSYRAFYQIGQDIQLPSLSYMGL